MEFNAVARQSDSPLVEMIYRTHSESAGTFTSVAASNWEMVVTKYNGKTNITVRGPETIATPAYCPPDAEFFGIVFKLGTFMPTLPLQKVMDRQDSTLPEASSKSFWLNGSAWELPTFDNADTFVSRLTRQGLLAHDSVVDAVLQERPIELSIRTVRRRFLQATGLTYGTIQQIERARRAMALLQQGTPILDVVFDTGYFDQPHMTRSLKHFVGQTPAQIVGVTWPVPESLLFNTASFS